jgi:hypothetical protein
VTDKENRSASYSESQLYVHGFQLWRSIDHAVPSTSLHNQRTVETCGKTTVTYLYVPLCHCRKPLVVKFRHTASSKPVDFQGSVGTSSSWTAPSDIGRHTNLALHRKSSLKSSKQPTLPLSLHTAVNVPDSQSAQPRRSVAFEDDVHVKTIDNEARMPASLLSRDFPASFFPSVAAGPAVGDVVELVQGQPNAVPRLTPSHTVRPVTCEDTAPSAVSNNAPKRVSLFKAARASDKASSS